MTPRSVVQPVSGPRKGEAGVVEKVEKDDAGKVVSVAARMDLDGALVVFDPAELKILFAH